MGHPLRRQHVKTAVNLLHEPGRKRPWIVRWYGEVNLRTGKQKRRGRSFRHHNEAKAFYCQLQVDFSRGEPRDPITVTLDELLQDFEEARLSGLSHASKEAYRNTFRQLTAYFGTDRKIREIDRRQAEAFIATRQRQDGRPGELSAWAKARHLIHMRALFTAAVAWGYADNNPFRVDRTAGQSPLRINPKGKPWQHITPTEFHRFLDVVLSVQMRTAYWLMYGCGLRVGEAINLMVSNVDLDRRRVHIVNRAATASVPPFTVKSDGQSESSKERSVPIPEAALPDLMAAMRQAFKSGGFLVLTPPRFETVCANWELCRDGKPWAQHPWRPWQNRDLMNNIMRDTKSLLVRAGVELTAPFSMHTLRKSFAQNHADAGTPPRTLAKLLGHSNTRVTMQFYNRVTDANDRAAREVMDTLFYN